MLYHFIATTKVQEANANMHLMRCEPDVQISSLYRHTTIELTFIILMLLDSLGIEFGLSSYWFFFLNSSF